MGHARGELNVKDFGYEKLESGPHLTAMQNLTCTERTHYRAAALGGFVAVDGLVLRV